MLTILGGPDSNRDRQCDGVSRRGFLKVGGMALGGLSLGQLLELEAAAGTGSSHKALINMKKILLMIHRLSLSQKFMTRLLCVT